MNILDASSCARWPPAHCFPLRIGRHWRKATRTADTSDRRLSARYGAGRRRTHAWSNDCQRSLANRCYRKHAGASGNLAAELVARAPADGYTLLQLTSVNSWNVALFDNLKFDLLRDLAPVASLYRGFGVVVVQPSFHAKTLGELIAYAKANPGQLLMGSAGVGTPQHLYGEMFKQMCGIDMLHVPYRGGGRALTDLLGGHVHVLFDPLVTAIPHIRSNELRALGVTSPTRIEVLPNVPAVAEVVPGYQAEGWQGIAAPANTPAEIIARLNKEINSALGRPNIYGENHRSGRGAVCNHPVGIPELHR